jgi:hypothetical protein
MPSPQNLLGHQRGSPLVFAACQTLVKLVVAQVGCGLWHSEQGEVSECVSLKFRTTDAPGELGPHSANSKFVAS